jgi:hypothetical protein
VATRQERARLGGGETLDAGVAGSRLGGSSWPQVVPSGSASEVADVGSVVGANVALAARFLLANLQATMQRDPAATCDPAHRASHLRVTTAAEARVATNKVSNAYANLAPASHSVVDSQPTCVGRPASVGCQLGAMRALVMANACASGQGTYGHLRYCFMRLRW